MAFKHVKQMMRQPDTPLDEKTDGGKSDFGKRLTDEIIIAVI